jgi:hypothetical protein
MSHAADSVEGGHGHEQSLSPCWGPSVDIIRGYFSTSIDLARANLLSPSALKFQPGNQRVIVLT